MLSRFHLIPERYRQTDKFAISISRVSMPTRDKNDQLQHCYLMNSLYLLCMCCSGSAECGMVQCLVCFLVTTHLQTVF